MKPDVMAVMVSSSVASFSSTLTVAPAVLLLMSNFPLSPNPCPVPAAAYAVV